MTMKQEKNSKGKERGERANSLAKSMSNEHENVKLQNVQNWSELNFHFLWLKFAVPSETSSREKREPKDTFLQFNRQYKWNINHWLYFLAILLRDHPFIRESWFLMNISCVWVCLLHRFNVLRFATKTTYFIAFASMLNKREMLIFMCSVSTETVLHMQVVYRWCKYLSLRSKRVARLNMQNIVQFLMLLHK